MSPAPQRVRWHRLPGAEALGEAAAQRILDAGARAIRARGRFLVALAGGTTPRAVYRRLRATGADWTAWHIYFGDERCLPRSHPDRNSRMAGCAWLDHVPLPSGQVHPIPAELGPHQAASEYAALLRGVGEFDLVLLGLGEDGHTASLFPGDARGLAPGAPDALPVLDAPKPPPHRVTLAAARLSRAAEVVFLVDGEDKRGAVARWRSGADIPARAIRPRDGVDVLLHAGLLDAGDREMG
jgi:6-phosphogluconolactonase